LGKTAGGVHGVADFAGKPGNSVIGVYREECSPETSIGIPDGSGLDFEDFDVSDSLRGLDLDFLAFFLPDQRFAQGRG
jgi:hypothetical protein